jgi:uncharacterized membrane protein YuzA (DUF378 family)|tara:strand:- start:5807 stop:5974 length:168 start_codon:yes stop_codon:yes gene_type:complete
MDKQFYKSLTFWGALGWGVVGVLEQFTAQWGEAAVIAKAISSFLIIFGLRRAIPQ